MTDSLLLPTGVGYFRQAETAIVTLNRPDKRNALDAASVDALIRIVEAAAHDGTRLLVLRGNGRSFCSGFDFSGFDNSSEGDLVLRFIRIEQLLQLLHHAPYQTLALAHGPCFGAGVDIVCACANRVATSATTFRMPGLQFGIVLGTRRLALRIGIDRAREVLQESKSFDALRALEMGFLTRISDDNEWDDLIAQAADVSSMLQDSATRALNRVSIPDTRIQDLYELTTSAAHPGLIERIRKYRDISSTLAKQSGL